MRLYFSSLLGNFFLEMDKGRYTLLTTPTGDPMTLNMELLIAFSSNRPLTSDRLTMKVVLILCFSILAATFGAPLDRITEEDSEEALDAEVAQDAEEAWDADEARDAEDDEDYKDLEDDEIVEDAEDDENPEDDMETAEDTEQLADGRMADAKRHQHHHDGGKHHGHHGHHGDKHHHGHHGHHGHHHLHNQGLASSIAGKIESDIAFAGELLLLLG